MSTHDGHTMQDDVAFVAFDGKNKTKKNLGESDKYANVESYAGKCFADGGEKWSLV